MRKREKMPSFEGRKEEAEEKREPSPEDYRGWRQEAEKRRESLKSWREKMARDWRGVDRSVGGMGLAFPRVESLDVDLKNYNYIVGTPIVELDRELEQLVAEGGDLSEPQRRTLELARESERLKEQRDKYMSELEKLVVKADKEVGKELQDAIERGKIKKEERREIGTERMWKRIDDAEETLYQKYPELKVFSDKIDQLRATRKAQEEEEPERENALIDAEKKQEVAEWKALYGDEPMHHLFDSLRQLLASGRLEKHYDPDTAKKCRQFIKYLERQYYLKGPEGIFKCLSVDPRWRGGLFPPE